MKLFSQAATLLLGLLTGGMLLIATGLVPYWQTLDAEEFTTAFATSLPTVGGTMAILTVLATVSTIGTAVLATRKKLPSRKWLIGAAAATIVMLVTIPVYFGKGNSLLAGGFGPIKSQAQ